MPFALIEEHASCSFERGAKRALRATTSREASEREQLDQITGWRSALTAVGQRQRRPGGCAERVPRFPVRARRLDPDTDDGREVHVEWTCGARQVNRGPILESREAARAVEIKAREFR